MGIKSFCDIGIHNVLFARNAAKRGGGVWCFNATLLLENGTFYGNAGLESSGGIWSSQGTLTVRNSIIAFSTAGEALSCSRGADIVISCSDFYGNAGGDGIGDCMSEGIGNFSADPRLVDPRRDDYALAPDSPCRSVELASGRGCGLIGFASNP